MKKTAFVFLLPALLFISCMHLKGTSAGKDDGKIEVVFLQMNDVYEISPLGDHTGGLARVAAIRRQLKKEHPNVITVLCGDFISPSVIGTLKYEGKRIRGKQMVEALNAVGVDWVVFGNHEFDYDDQADLQARINESAFTWLGANVRQKNADGSLSPFYKQVADRRLACPDYAKVALRDADGTTLELGLFGVVLNTGRKPYVAYEDPLLRGRAVFNALRDSTDVVVALTHLNIADDLKLAAALPEVPLFMGGHDHENMRHVVGGSVVAKADANARTVYVHTLKYDKKKQRATVKSRLVEVEASIPDEPAAAAVVQKWEKIKNSVLGSSGFDPERGVAYLSVPLDCRESTIRYVQAPAGQLITRAMRAAATQPTDAALVNSGSIRVDDLLRGQIAEMDVVRMLPFGGGLSEIDIRGSLLRRTLDTGFNNKGSGGFLQWDGVVYEGNQYILGGGPLDDNRVYRLVVPDFLLTGNEQNMGFLKTTTKGNETDNPGIPQVIRPESGDKEDVRNDIRLAVIRYLRQQ